MAKYGMQTYLEPEENIKFESDNKYLRDVPSERTIYDFQTEIDFLFNKGQVIDSKVHMMSDIICSISDLKGTINIPYKTESDFQASNLVIDSKLKDITSKVSECLKGTGLEVGPNPQSFKSNFVDVKLESFDGMNFEQKVIYRNEGIGSVFSKIWEYIKKFFSWVWDSIKKLFNSVFNLFRSNKKLLENLKLELEKMDITSGERAEGNYSKKIVFFTQIIDQSHRLKFTEDLSESLEKAKSKLKDFVEDAKEYVIGITNLGNQIGGHLGTLKSEVEKYIKVDPKLTFCSTLGELRPNNKIYHNGDYKAINVSKFRDNGNYYLIGMEDDNAVFLYSANGIQASIVKASILDNATIFKKMTPEAAKQELIDICELGINICENYDKKSSETLETDLKGVESELLNIVEEISGVDIGDEDKIKEMGLDEDSAKKLAKEFPTEVSRLVNGLTKITNGTISAIIASITVIAKQPTFIIQAVRDGMDTIE